MTVLLLIGGAQPTMAQHKHMISGKVFGMLDGKREPLAGANVYWEGTTMGTTTDEDGRYEIELHPDEHCLVFSYMGFKNDTVHGMAKPLVYNHTLKNIIELDEVSVTARQKGSFVSELTTIQTEQITSEGLCRAACCNLAESFETNASVNVSYSDAVTGAKQIELLGLSGLYTQMMAENMPTLRGLAATMGLAYVPGSWMKGIQVSKGTSSVINGFESISGQINIDYKHPKPDQSEKLYVNLFGSSMGMVEFNLNTRVSLNEHLHTMIFAHAGSNLMKCENNGDGFLDDPMTNQYNLFWRLNFKKDKIGFQFGAKALKETRQGGQYDFEPATRATNGLYGIQLNTDRYEAFLKNGFMFDRPETSIGIQQQIVYHAIDSYFGNTDYEASQTSYYANALFASYIGNTNHKYTTGFSFSYDGIVEDIALLGWNHKTRKDIVPGAFFEYNYNNGHDLSVMAGMRVDHHNRYGFFATPRLHAKYTIHHETTLRFSAGKGYRMPNVLAENTTMLATSRNLIIMSDDFGMEEAWNMGIGISRHFDIGARELGFSADFYRTDFVNQVIIDRDKAYNFIYVYNLNGKSFSNCAQIELNCELFRDFDATAAFRFNDVKMTIDDQLREKPLTNRYKGLLTLSYAPKTWQFDYTLQLNGDSRVPDVSLNPKAVEGQTIERSPAYVIMNLQVTRKFEKWDLYFGGENLTNYVQDSPIIGYDTPFDDGFDSSLVWGPLSGIRAYAGFRYSIK